MRRRWWAVLVLCWIACSGGGELRVGDAVAHSTPGSAVGVVYLTVSNPGPADRLVGVRSGTAMGVELHETVEDGDLVRMVPRPEGWVVPAGGVLELRASGPHIMLMGLREALEPGDEIDLVLVFEGAGERSLRARVEPRI